MTLFILKALHIIAVVVWFAGLFYIGRLFVYHREADEHPEQVATILKNQYTLMEKRLWYAITWPGAVFTLITGTAMLYWHGFPAWVHAKITLVALLFGYHLWCGVLRKQLLSGSNQWSGKRFRLFNEVPSLLLIAIVFVVVMKGALSWPIFLASLFGVLVVIGGTVQLLAKRRKP